MQYWLYSMYSRLWFCCAFVRCVSYGVSESKGIHNCSSRQRMATEIQQALSQSMPQQQPLVSSNIAKPDLTGTMLLTCLSLILGHDMVFSSLIFTVIPPHLHNTPAGMGSPKLSTTVPKHNYGTKPVLDHTLSK